MSDVSKSADDAESSAAPEVPLPVSEPVTDAPVPEPVVAAPVAGVASDQVPRFANGKPSIDESGEPIATQRRLAAAILCWFLGIIGVHRFYVGKVGTGVLMIVTLGGLGIWMLIDFIMILIGSFRNKAGLKLYNW